MLSRQYGFRLFLDDGYVDIVSNLVENAMRSPATLCSLAIMRAEKTGLASPA